jgi:hypothetical protein
LVVAVDAQVAVALVAVSVVVTVLVVAAVMVQVPAQSLALEVVAEVVLTAQATILNLALAILVHRATHVPLLVLIVLLIHALQVGVAPLTHVLQVAIALVIHVRLLVHVLLNPKLVVNVEVLAVTKHGSPSSSPFCMESSRFRCIASSATQVAAMA